ncbi:MAG: bifunctional sugar-1-phosphate nucleotidylyltransferase/acetyltransferase [Candidatus Heimdallarchaeota archaeon]
MEAIVLAAGIGTRLAPLTNNFPKPLLNIAGKPILKRIIDDLKKSDQINNINVVVNYQADRIITEINNWYPNDETIQIIHQNETNGTADAVNSAILQTNIEDNFLVINGDVLFEQNLPSMINTSYKDGLIVGVKTTNPNNYGLIRHKDNLLLNINEKPDSSSTSIEYINAVFYILPKASISLLSSLKQSKRGELEITDLLNLLVQENFKITVLELENHWFDIGYPWEILNANEFFINKESMTYTIDSKTSTNATIIGNVQINETANIRNGVYIEGPVFIDDGADIGPNCYIRAHSYIGKNTRVGNACEIKNSILSENSHVAHLSYIGDTFVGNNTNLGAGTITANLRHDNKSIKLNVKEDRVDTGRRKLGAIIGHDVKTGIGVNLLPGVKISSGSWINAGETIKYDL